MLRELDVMNDKLKISEMRDVRNKEQEIRQLRVAKISTHPHTAELEYRATICSLH